MKRFHPSFFKLFSIVLAAVVLTAPSVSSALVTNLDPSYTTREANLLRHLADLFPKWKAFPHWKRVGRIENGTGVYLGKGVVLTAAHIGEGTFTLADGSRYSAIAGSQRNYTNLDGTRCDLCIFRINVPVGSALSKKGQLGIRIGTPPANSTLVMIGAGSARRHGSLRWKDDHRLRWGFNRIGQTRRQPFKNHFGHTFGFYTDFGTGKLDCQGAPGDSGGAAFYYDEGAKQWHLAGVIVAGTALHKVQETHIGEPDFCRESSSFDQDASNSARE